VTGNKLIVELETEIWNMAYKPGIAALPGNAHKNENFSSGAPGMFLSKQCSIATAQGKNLHQAQLQRKAMTPKTNVHKNLKILEALGMVRSYQDGKYTRYEFDLAVLDRAMNLEHVDKWIRKFRNTADEMQRLRDLLLTELRANSAAAARKRDA
jgi:DNA-binding transcriptional ArsR family regulator